MREIIFAALLFVGGDLGAAHAAKDAPSAPNSIVLIACRVDDLTGVAGRQDPAMAAHGWRDLEWHVENGQYECRREVISNIVDEVGEQHPELRQMRPDFGKPEQCGAIGVTFVADWELKHPGWGVLAIGCPSKITDGGPDGPVVGWKLPGCPANIPGTDTPMKCDFDDTAI